MPAAVFPCDVCGDPGHLVDLDRIRCPRHELERLTLERATRGVTRAVVEALALGVSVDTVGECVAAGVRQRRLAQL